MRGHCNVPVFFCIASSPGRCRNTLPRQYVHFHTNSTCSTSRWETSEILAGGMCEGFCIGMFFFNALNPLLRSSTTSNCIQHFRLQKTSFSSYVAPSSSSSSSGRLPGQGSMVTATPMPLRPTVMLVTQVHSFLSGQ